MAKRAAGQVVEVSFEGFEEREAVLRVIGRTSFISNAFSEKKKGDVEAAQTKTNTGGRAAKDIEEEFRGSLYINKKTGSYCLTTDAFKKAMIAACRHDNRPQFTLVWAKGAFQVLGEFVDLEDCNGGYWRPGVKEPTMRRDVVRIGRGRGTIDLRYRGEYFPWAATLTIAYNPKSVSLEQIGYLLHLAGFHVGVGGKRPESGHSHGMFRLDAKSVS